MKPSELFGSGQGRTPEDYAQSSVCGAFFIVLAVVLFLILLVMGWYLG